MADKPVSTSLQPSNSGNLMYFFIFKFKYCSDVCSFNIILCQIECFSQDLAEMLLIPW